MQSAIEALLNQKVIEWLRFKIFRLSDEHSIANFIAYSIGNI
jgi:hypothetical protein